MIFHITIIIGQLKKSPFINLILLRHEKTKKKRGSYKGGPINMGVASIKFDSD